MCRQGWVFFVWLHYILYDTTAYPFAWHMRHRLARLAYADAIPLSKFRWFGVGGVSRVEWRAPRPVQSRAAREASQSKPLPSRPSISIATSTATLPEQPTKKATPTATTPAMTSQYLLVLSGLLSQPMPPSHQPSLFLPPST